ncbi:TetR/AcrR family transcriptional regulator [Actinomadura sp. HBU206391]|uniref:TetR/AcrR family transcriptional regulator n=1 Tax=Actinomadura sp. HBU206391 TaxID=2731692 RepID=UPI0016505C6A|nr:TetR/AcrR family transcriptional regulator [Actinomadura sp. HBU206391]MBC6459679.1 TetR/AcrR family transcriptional regulator [Actinomadura sp. HBU206391]
MPKTSDRGRYHHGDLKEAVLDTAVKVIAEHGLSGFSLAEASRRLGVTVAAPYRHFADRDEVLVALALRAVDRLSAALEAETGEAGEPAEAGETSAAAERLADCARGYVRFAATNRSLYLVLLNSTLDKSRYTELQDAGQRIGGVFLQPALELCDQDAAAAQQLVIAIIATTQGYAAMVLDGTFGPGSDAVDTATTQAANAVFALVRGRAALGRP